MLKYEDFLKRKEVKPIIAGHSVSDDELNENLFDFQRAIVKWALRRGRAAIFADTGLGKTLMQTSWADNVVQHTGGDVLSVACKNLDGEESNDEIEVQHDGANVECGFNFHYLRDAANAIDGDVVNMAFRSDTAGAVLISGTDSALRCVVMPMRI